MCVEDFDIGTPEGRRNKRFWCTVGGGIESSESIQDTALREIYEETGITKEDIELGPVVWTGQVDLVLKGILTRLEEVYIVAKTMKVDVVLCDPTHDERLLVKKLSWFSLEGIQQCTDTIFPMPLVRYLPDILAEKYPEKPFEIDLETK